MGAPKHGPRIGRSQTRPKYWELPNMHKGESELAKFLVGGGLLFIGKKRCRKYLYIYIRAALFEFFGKLRD